MRNDLQRLLRPGDPAPVEVVNPAGASPFLLVGDHAGNLVPSGLSNFGVADDDLARHIGWDIGVDGLGRNLAARLDAVFVRQRYSRLVVDCNRDPASSEAVPAESDRTPVPGNANLDAAAREQRIAEIHEPYHAAIAAALEARVETIFVALHSFTPVLAGSARPWQIGVLHNGHNDGFAQRLLDWLERNAGLVVGDNEPYRMDDTDYTVPRHAFPAGLPYVEIEVRQDRLDTSAAIDRMADVLARGMAAALA